LLYGVRELTCASTGWYGHRWQFVIEMVQETPLISAWLSLRLHTSCDADASIERWIAISLQRYTIGERSFVHGLSVVEPFQ